MTNKLFIVKYVFVVDVDFDENKDKNDIFLRNFDINLDKRESFDDANFDVIIAQNICFLDIANDVVDKIKLNILNIASEINIVDEIKRT